MQGVYAIVISSLNQFVDVVKDSLIEEFKVFNVKGVELLIEHIEDAYLLITQAHFYFELRNYNHFQINCLMDLLSINNIYIVYSDKFTLRPNDKTF
ncbi:unnamed protein product [Rhizophagus irregularis]|nr:unnamed protein product [Rhizophagus irregularis]